MFIMELTFFENIGASGYAEDIRALLTLADKEFVPPLSARSSSTQADLSGSQSVPDGVAAYYAAMSTQPAIVALESGKVLGFMAFKIDYTCENISLLPNLYASTCVVHPDARGQGLMGKFYSQMIALFPDRSIFTRTWATNHSHLHVLEKLGFTEHARLKNHRGEGLDTVYFHRLPK